MDPYLVAAAIAVVLTGQVAIVALFMGRDRMIADLRREWNEADQ